MPRKIYAPVRGANFRPESARQRLLDYTPDMPICLTREPDNAHDSNAIQVWVGHEGNEEFVGYVGREFAEELAPRMDAGLPTSAKIDHYLSALMPVLEIVVDDGDEPKEAA